MNYTPDQINNRTSDYICFDCGEQFIEPDRPDQVVTAHTGECGLCGEVKSVAHYRLFNYLQFKNRKDETRSIVG